MINLTGLGICLRNEQGLFIRSKTAWFAPELLVHEGEAVLWSVGLLIAIQWVMEQGLDKRERRYLSALLAFEVFNLQKRPWSEAHLTC